MRRNFNRKARHYSTFVTGHYSIRSGVLAYSNRIIIISRMKFLLITAAHFVIVGVLGAGIYMLMHGKPGLLIAGVAIYSLVFSKMCLSSH
jgi:hypothetical protein